MAKLTPKEMKEIQRIAHDIRRHHPDLKWSQCVARAGRQFCKNRR